MRIVVFAMLLGVVPPFAYAQTPTTLTGTWQAGADGQRPWLVIFRQEDSRLAGIVSSCGSAPVGVVAAEIYGGSVDKNTLRFKCKSGEDGREITFQGRHNANEIELTYEQQARN